MLKLKASYEKHRKIVDQIVEIVTKQAEADELQAKDQIQSSTWLLLIIFGIAISIGIGGSILVSRSITAPLSEAVDAAQVVASGDLTGQIEVIGDDEVAIGFLGRLVMEKGLDVFSDTIDELRRRGIPHKVLVVGEGPAREWFEARLPGAAFAGFQGGSDLGRAVASMDVLFNPSITETFGNVTLEAMACALPVVAAAATGSESLVDDQTSGRLIRPGAIHAFAEALRAYIADPALRARHGAAGAQRAAEFSWDRINQTVADTYLRLIRQKTARQR